MQSTPFEDLVHRVNNLLGTIAIQAEVAAAEGTLDAHRAALQVIAESAQRTRQMLQQLRGAKARGHVAGAGGDSSGSIAPSF